MTDLLPSNATAFERAASLTMDASARVGAGIAAMRTAKLVSTPDEWLPWLIAEYGLGPVSVYVPSARALIETGIDWQRVRGTPGAVQRGLAWIGYAAQIEQAPITRRRWHLFQLALDRVRDAEQPDLESVEGVVSLSVPVRSRFWRGFRGYDVREAEWSRRPWSGARYASSSGARLRPGGTKWSFGRGTDINILLSPEELVALSAWQQLPDSELIGWGLRFAQTYGRSQATWGEFSWDGTGATWATYGETERLNLMASALFRRPLWICFRDAAGDVIGFRRAKAASPVVLSPSGPYRVGPFRFLPVSLGTSFYVEALTDFGDGDGRTALTASLVWDALPLDTSRPGLQWAGPGELSPGVEVAARPVHITFGRTVRERLRYHLTF
jgi:P2-related tail formation protein